MKKIAVTATITMMTLTRLLRGTENTEKPLFDLGKQHVFYRDELSCDKHRHHRHHREPTRPAGPLGSYYFDASSPNNPQTIVLPNSTPPFTDSVQFSGTNANSGVSLSLSGTSIVVHANGNYKIDWNIAASLIQSNEVDFHLDLQKNGTTLLHPSPQAQCQLQNFVAGAPFTSAAASVIVPLLTNDEISLLLTIDGSEGNIAGDGVQVNSAQISATWSSP